MVRAAASRRPTCSPRPSRRSPGRVSVALVEQPYRVAGAVRRRPRQLDAAWISVVEQLRARELRRLPLLVGGRSSGARVACRTAADVGGRRRPLPRLPAAAAGTEPAPQAAEPPARAVRVKVPYWSFKA
jgi:surfactin synthase thioesterase subunit